jgi:2-oxoglutaroyl-CoA hydrolase
LILGTSRSLSEGLELEKELADYVVTTEDFEEGCSAFLEKRKPNFKAR